MRVRPRSKASSDCHKGNTQWQARFKYEPTAHLNNVSGTILVSCDHNINRSRSMKQLLTHTKFRTSFSSFADWSHLNLVRVLLLTSHTRITSCFFVSMTRSVFTQHSRHISSVFRATLDHSAYRCGSVRWQQRAHCIGACGTIS